MPLTKAPQVPVSQQSAVVGTPVAGLAFPVNYGVSGIATITNGPTGPSQGISVFLDFSTDGLIWTTGPAIGVGGTGNNEVTIVPFALGIGAGGDWNYYRVRFAGNLGQSVTIRADAHTTTGL